MECVVNVDVYFDADEETIVERSREILDHLTLHERVEQVSAESPQVLE